ncbi:MAG: carbohydrate ABC transporter permease [candidate division NC10 bacterium]|nr:carbohydrate ABC transporter permease [candidate division NC10 bacterium]
MNTTSHTNLSLWVWVRRGLLGAAILALVVWTVFPFFWILLTSLKQPLDVIAAPPKLVFSPTADNYRAVFIGQQRGLYASARPDFPRFFLNSIIISCGAVGLSFLAGIPASYALARYSFRFKEQLAFLFLSFRFAPFITFLIPLYILFQQLGLYNTYSGLILAYQLITLPFTVWMLRSFFMEIPLEVEEAAKIRKSSCPSACRGWRSPSSWASCSAGTHSTILSCWRGGRHFPSRWGPSSSSPTSRSSGARWRPLPSSRCSPS